MGRLSLFMTSRRLLWTAVVIQPFTLLKIPPGAEAEKYRWLFSSRHGDKPGPKGPSAELISTIVAIKQRNNRYGCPRIAFIITNTFSISVDKKWCGESWRNIIGPIPFPVVVLCG